MPLPRVEVGVPEEYYRGMKLWQCRPDARTWTVRKADATTTCRAFNEGKGGTVYRAVRVDYTDGGFLNFSYDKDSGLLSKLEDHHGRTVVFGLDYERGLILSANLLREGQLETLAEYEYDERRNLVLKTKRKIPHAAEPPRKITKTHFLPLFVYFTNLFLYLCEQNFSYEWEAIKYQIKSLRLWQFMIMELEATR